MGRLPGGRTADDRGALTVLAVDTATRACSVAVCRGEVVLGGRTTAMERGHAEALMPMVVQVLADAGLGFADLDLIAVTIGPGAFTGLRVGLAAARGMALAADIPCIGVTTLEAIAASIPAERRRPGTVLMVALDTRRRDLYVQTFAADGTAMSPPRTAAAADLAAIVGDATAGGPVQIAGDAGAVAADALRRTGVPANNVPGLDVADAASVAAVAAARWRQRRTAGPATKQPPAPAPLYLRPPEARVAPGGGRRRP